jgi:hypothetical protein
MSEDIYSKYGKKWLEKFKKSGAGDQNELLDIMHEAFPTKPARDLPRELSKDPIERERQKEMRELIKEKYKKSMKA